MPGSPNSEAQRLLADGIQAFNTGDLDRARDLFLRAVELDERQEMAWLWLVEVVDDLVDKATALENVLSINPANAEARQRLEAIKAKSENRSPESNPAALFTPEPAPPPTPAAVAADHWRDLLPQAPLEDDDDIDDPYQCVYCGTPTLVQDSRCPRCRRNLYWNVQKSDDSGNLQLTMLLMGVSAALGLVQIAGAAMGLGARQAESLAGYQLLIDIYHLDWLIGPFLSYSTQQAQTLMALQIGRSTLLGVLLLLLTQRFTWAYYGSMLALVGDIVLSLVLAAAGWAGIVGMLIHAVLAGIGLFLLFGSDREFAVNEERLFTRPDPDLRVAIDFYQRGRWYSQRGMWAQAVAQWRRAVGLAPAEAVYYKDLGVGYARLKRYRRSLRALKEAQRLLPNNPTLAEVIQLVRTEAGKAGIALPDDDAA